jgi:hypothetical protein
VLLRLSMIASQKGDPRRGAERAQAGLDIAEQLGLGQLTGALLFGCGFAALQRGQPAEVIEAARRGLELSRAVGERVYLLCHEWLLGALDLTLATSLLPPPGSARSPASFLLLADVPTPRASRRTPSRR